MLVNGNQKLGNRIWSWSIPAVRTCPGASDVCRELCYATKGFYNYRSTQDSHRRNLTSARAQRFITRMLEDIDKHHVDCLRIHASGDFYSHEYLAAWIKIARQREDTTFFGYTRSWSLPSYIPGLEALASLPNVSFWLSCDKGMERPPRIDGTRLAWMATDDNDLPKFKTDLIFRVEHETPLKRMGRHKTLVCPYEQGVLRQVKITCSSCKICDFKPQPPS